MLQRVVSYGMEEVLVIHAREAGIDCRIKDKRVTDNVPPDITMAAGVSV